jgi:flagellar hook protein FlgE
MAVGSFSAGLSGLNANSVYLNVIGNNLSNINTIGFKASSVSFMDLVSQSTGGSSINPMQVGLGVVVGQMSPVYNQGAIEATGEATNAAIQGNGFFVVKNPDGGVFYTRAGNFSLNKDGALVTPDGLTVQGYTIVPAGVLRAPTPTSLFRTTSNLDVNAPVGATFESPIQVYDALGATHVMTVSYTRSATGWDFDITVPGDEVTPAQATPYSLATGSVTFDALGAVQVVAAAAPATGGGSLPGTPITDVTFSGPSWANGAAQGVVSLTGYASPSATSSLGQNGNAAGKIDAISINVDGSIMATFGAGQTVAVGKLALASFNNNKGLVKMGSNRYGESEASGVPNTGSPGTGGRGTLVGSALEQSNVDMAQQFTQMILAQRGSIR